MANVEHLTQLQSGLKVWSQWREANPNVIPDLREANLAGAHLFMARLFKADLSKSNLGHADLREARLSETNLIHADLRGADLSGAELIAANLSRADLRGAKLRKADLRGADLRGANFSEANLSGASLDEADLRGTVMRGADLTGASLAAALMLRTNLQGATLSGCSVHGISAWDVNLEGAAQSNLVITSGQPPIQVDDLEVAQFIYLLLNRRKLRDAITTLGEKAVLILGRFTERKDLLDRMADKLRSLRYIPIIFDFERPTDRDLTETVRILAGLSRFVIADITNPQSVPVELGAIVPDYMVPFVTIVQRGQPAFGMFDDFPRKYHWALPLLEYNTPATLLASFEQKVVAPALEKVDAVRREKAAAPVRRSAEG